MGTTSSTIKEITSKPRLLDEIAFVASLSVVRKLDKSQVNKLLEVLEASQDLDIVCTFLARQVARKEWPKESAARLFKILSGINTLEGARIALGIFKWLFEAGLGNRNVVNNLMSKYKYVRSPQQVAPSNFYKQYLRVLLS